MTRTSTDQRATVIVEAVHSKIVHISFSFLLLSLPESQAVVPDDQEDQSQAVEGQQGQLCRLALIAINEHGYHEWAGKGHSLQVLQPEGLGGQELAQPGV